MPNEWQRENDMLRQEISRHLNDDNERFAELRHSVDRLRTSFVRSHLSSAGAIITLLLSVLGYLLTHGAQPIFASVPHEKVIPSHGFAMKGQTDE